MNTPQTHQSDLGHAAALQTLFPGGMAAMDAAHVRALLSDYAESRARYTGPLEAPAARANGMAGMSSMGSELYELRAGGVAVIQWAGVMLQRPSFLARLFLGVVDTSELAAAVTAASKDGAVRSVVLQVDSPGGGVHGTAELCAAVTEAARVKPVVAVAEGLLGSAAYWAVSGCSSVYGTSPTVMAGSIGAVTVHTYAPRADGAVVTEITSGKFKTVGSSDKPLASDDLAHIQAKIDYIATQFINTVAKGRNLTPAAVAAQEARVYIGQQAVDAGLLDGFMSMGELEAQLAADPGRFMRRRPAGAPASAPAPTQAASAAAPWPPKYQPVKAVASPEAMLEQPGQAEQDLRAEAAEIVRVHRLTTGRFPKVMSWKGWESVGAARAAKDGCSVVQGMKREGYLHPYVSQSDHGKRGAPGVKPVLQLTRAQMAERSAAWAQFKGCSVVEAFKYLGFQF